MSRLTFLALPMLALAACATLQSEGPAVYAVVSVHPPRMDPEHVPTFSQGPAQLRMTARERLMAVLPPAVAVICDAAHTECRHGIVTVRTTVQVESATSNRVRGHVTVDSEVGRRSELRSDGGTNRIVFTQTVADDVPALEERRNSDTAPFELGFGETLRFPTFHGGEVELSFRPEVEL